MKHVTILRLHFISNYLSMLFSKIILPPTCSKSYWTTY